MISLLLLNNNIVMTISTHICRVQIRCRNLGLTPGSGYRHPAMYSPYSSDPQIPIVAFEGFSSFFHHIVLEEHFPEISAVLPHLAYLYASSDLPLRSFNRSKSPRFE